MEILISVSVSLLVIVAGMLLLAKTKKDDLGNMFSFASYSVITIGLLVFLGSFIGGVMHHCKARQGKGHCGYSAKQGHHGAYKSCASWSDGSSKSKCGKSQKCEKKCCGKSDKKCKGRKESRKTIKTSNGEGDETVNIEIEITE